MSIQNIDLTEFYDVNIHCPFCGDKVIDYGAENSDEAGVLPCKHTLYIASEEAWEYQSETFNKHLGLVGVDLNEVGLGKDELPEKYKDLFSNFELIEKIKIPDSLNISQHVGPPAMMVGYIGFYPMYED